MAQSDDENGEKTEQATPRRIEQAREDGQVPRSKELTTFLVMMASVGLLIALGGYMYDKILAATRDVLTFNQITLRTTTEVAVALYKFITRSMIALFPFLGGVLVVAVLAPMAIGGWNFSTKALEPKFSKLDPIKGLKRLVSLQALVEGIKAILKSILIGGVATFMILQNIDVILHLIKVPIEIGLSQLVDLMRKIFLVVVGAMVIIAIIDAPYQLWQYYKDLRMSKQDIKQEFKQMEGSIEMKSKVRQIQREAAKKRMMQEIPHASVVVTNPTRFAVALKYIDGNNAAPIVVAKGSLRLAQQIITISQEHGVPLVRIPPLARALYFNVEVGDEIPEQLYNATAQVLAYVYQLKDYEAGLGSPPIYPDNVEIPEGMDQPRRRYLG